MNCDCCIFWKFELKGCRIIIPRDITPIKIMGNTPNKKSVIITRNDCEQNPYKAVGIFNMMTHTNFFIYSTRKNKIQVLCTSHHIISVESTNLGSIQENCYSVPDSFEKPPKNSKFESWNGVLHYSLSSWFFKMVPNLLISCSSDWLWNRRSATYRGRLLTKSC